MAMSAIGRGWSLWARLRRRLHNVRQPAHDEWSAENRRWIREHVPGRTFADIGGLFALHGSMAFEAEDAGASAATEFDVGNPEFSEFADERRRRGSQVRYVQGDLDEPESVRRIGPHDIVYCHGVLYHSPSPARQLMHLREITRELLYLGSLTIPEIPGFPQACVYYPHLPPGERRQYAAGYKWNSPEKLLAIGAPVDERPMHGYGNCWWGITRSSLHAMLATARFEVIEEHPTFASPYYARIVARPVEGDPLLPPLSYFREYGEQRERGGPLSPFEPIGDYYEARRREVGSEKRRG